MGGGVPHQNFGMYARHKGKNLTQKDKNMFIKKWLKQIKFIKNKGKKDQNLTKM